MIPGCAIILSTFLGCSGFLGTFWGYSGILGTLLGYSRIFGYHFWAILVFLGIIFLVKSDFFKNNPDFWVLS